MIFRHTCDVKRNAPVGTNGRHQKQILATGKKCLLIPMASRYEIENGFTVGSAYDAYFPDPATDVKSGDQLIWNGDTYNVRAARPYDVPRVGHLHCLVVREGK